MFQPLHPGEIVKDALIDATGLSVTEAAKKLGVSRIALSRLINCHAGISPEMALRLSKLFETSIDLWMNIQNQYATWEISQHKDEIDVERFIFKPPMKQTNRKHSSSKTIKTIPTLHGS